jgi:hypothetical protein
MVSIQALGLPIGTVALRCTPSGADTEVRPPATRWLAPGHGGLWGWVQRVFRFRCLGCPSERFLSDPNPAERTQRSAPPRPAVRSLATGGFGCGRSGVSDACGLAVHRDGCPPMQAQWSGHGGPPPRDPLCGPWPRGALGVGPADLPFDLRFVFTMSNQAADRTKPMRRQSDRLVVRINRVPTQWALPLSLHTNQVSPRLSPMRDIDDVHPV